MPKHLKEAGIQEFKLNINVPVIQCTQEILDKAIIEAKKGFADNANPDDITAFAKRLIISDYHRELIDNERNSRPVRPHGLDAKIAAALAAKVKIDTNTT